MANEIKYQPQIWGEPIAGERLSTNGHYRGEQLGSSTQDALVAITPHHVEETIIRRGTITQDVLNKIEQASDYVEIGSGRTMNVEEADSSGYVHDSGYFHSYYIDCRVGNYVSFGNDPTGQKYEVTSIDDSYVPTCITFDGDYCPGYDESVTVYALVVPGSGNPIIFYIQGNTYRAEEGMTWDDFINSEYNERVPCSCGSDHELIYTDGTTIYYLAGDCEGIGYVALYYYYSEMDECIEAHPSDEIEDEHGYMWC